MATEKQKEAARRNIEKAREVQSERAHGEDIPRSSEGLSTAEKDRLPEAEFAFPADGQRPPLSGPTSGGAGISRIRDRDDQGSPPGSGALSGWPTAGRVGAMAGSPARRGPDQSAGTTSSSAATAYAACS